MAHDFARLHTARFRRGGIAAAVELISLAREAAQWRTLNTAGSSTPETHVRPAELWEENGTCRKVH